MEVSAESLRERYRVLTDDDLVKLYEQGTLIDIAKTVILEELNSRKYRVANGRVVRSDNAEPSDKDLVSSDIEDSDVTRLKSLNSVRIKKMRVVNGLAMIALIIAGSATSVQKDISSWSQIIDDLIGISVWIVPCYLTFWSLRFDSSLGEVLVARTVNYLALGLITLIVIYAFSDSFYVIFSEMVTTPAALAVLVPIPFFVIFILNIKALTRCVAEIKKTKILHANSSTEVSIPSQSSTTIQDSSSKPQSSANYFLRHWRGELSLPFSFWVNYLILTITVSVLLLFTLGYINSRDFSLRVLSIAALSVMILLCTTWLWSIVGVWRSAGKELAQNGSFIWANLALFIVLVSFMTMASNLTYNTFLFVNEYALIASGNDPVGEINVKVSTDGKVLIVMGEFREGSSSKIEKILGATPDVTALLLYSKGGRFLEAQRFSRIVRGRNLDTYVDGLCASACTFVFLAGRERVATTKARIGFHQPSFPGLGKDVQKAMTQVLMDEYRSAGLPEQFIQRIGMTPPDELWFPSLDKMIASKVVTRIIRVGKAGR